MWVRTRNSPLKWVFPVYFKIWYTHTCTPAVLKQYHGRSWAMTLSVLLDVYSSYAPLPISGTRKYCSCLFTETEQGYTLEPPPLSLINLNSNTLTLLDLFGVPMYVQLKVNSLLVLYLARWDATGWLIEMNSHFKSVLTHGILMVLNEFSIKICVIIHCLW